MWRSPRRTVLEHSLPFSAQTILYDNARIAVAQITGEGEWRPTEAFSQLQSHYLFVTKFGWPGL